ncbi:hypothetical protein JXC34_04570 [Candidatus Woesearchaeota archaeon]|nr:hypothetical protein [Candidatus Woesearchaeota archaeon]
MKLLSSVSVKGNYRKKGNIYQFKDPLILCKRTGSVVEIEKDRVIIDADITGIDKIYFNTNSGNLIISTNLRDFISGPVDQELSEVQEKIGYVPYPFTILSNVRKAPPGLRTIITSDNKEEGFKYRFEPGDQLKIYNKKTGFDKLKFKEDLIKLLKENSPEESLISSFSGGFDSLFLLNTYREKCNQIVHFLEDDKINISSYRKQFRDIDWHIIKNSEPFDDKDRKRFFSAIDEPNCDPAGFAEYLIARRVRENKKTRTGAIMNGQASDGIFCNSTVYFKEFISGFMPEFIRKSRFLDLFSKHEKGFFGKVYDLTVDTKRRFFRAYLHDVNLGKDYVEEIGRIFDIFAENIENDNTHLLAASLISLRYSLYGIEKVRSAAHALGVKYYLPAMSVNVISYVFSIPSRFKVGYPLGKRIFIKSYPEISRMKFTSRAFMPQVLKKRFFQDQSVEESDVESRYRKYFLDNWLETHKGVARLRVILSRNFVSGKKKNTYVYRDRHIVSKRTGTVVEIMDDSVNITTDVMGIDKVYYRIKGTTVEISDKFTDFTDEGINKEFVKFQQEMGYVPYPFTILKNVKKSPPGLSTEISLKNHSVICSYHPSDQLKIYDKSRFSLKTFKSGLTKMFLENYPKPLIPSFSGGFDSMLVTETYKDQCAHIVHFREDNKLDINYYKEVLPKAEWTIVENNIPFIQKDIKGYFNSVDEPCCDPAGFAEYMMIKSLMRNRHIRELPVMNGQGADGMFCNDPSYIKNYVAEKIGFPFRFKIDGLLRKKTISAKIYAMGIDTKTRFFETHIPNINISSESMQEIELIHDIFTGNIDNESTKTFAAVKLSLIYSLDSMEKVRNASRAFNVKYYLPYMSSNIIHEAFSIPARFLIGYPKGKRLIIKLYPEIKKKKFISRNFMPDHIKERFIGEELNETNYQKYFFREWMSANGVSL